jgi:hypothetical protein
VSPSTQPGDISMTAPGGEEKTQDAAASSPLPVASAPIHH